MSKEVVSLITARNVRNTAVDQVVSLFAPALEKERRQNIERQNTIEILANKVYELSHENEKMKTGGNEFDLENLKKLYGYILYEDVKDNLRPEVRKHIEKYLKS